MGEINSLSLEETMVVLACLNYVKDNAERDNADEVVNDIQNVMEKVTCTLRNKLAERKQFLDIIETSLSDVEITSQTIVGNPDVETPEYK